MICVLDRLCNFCLEERKSECTRGDDATHSIFVVRKRTEHAHAYQSFHTILEIQQVNNKLMLFVRSLYFVLLSYQYIREVEVFR